MNSLGIASGKFIWPKAWPLIALYQSPMYRLLRPGYCEHRVGDVKLLVDRADRQPAMRPHTEGKDERQA